MPPRKKQIEQPVENGGVDIITRGEYARKLIEHVYFQGIVGRMDEMYRGEVLGLHPTATAKFCAIQERRQGLIDLRGSIVADIEAGRKALAQAQGEHSKGRVA